MAIATATKPEEKDPAKRRGNLGKGRTQTRIAGRFRTTYTEQRLYEVVRKAAFYCRPNTPKELRQTEFDNCLIEINHADAPSARAIYKRLKRPWPEIVSDAVDENWNQTQKDAVKQKSDEAPWLTTDHVFYALRRATRHLKQKTVTRDQYQAARLDLIAADQKRHKFGGLLEENMPTVAQIERVAGNAKPTGSGTDWEKACEIAQLPKPGSEAAGETGKGGKRGLDISVVIHYFIEASNGYLPSSRAWLEKFARQANVAMARQEKGKPFTDYIKEANAYRIALGLEAASEFAPTNGTVTFDLSKLDLGEAPAAIVALTKEQKLAKIAEFLDHCDMVKAKPRQHLYKGLASKKGWPAAGHLGEGMTWGEWIKQADAWRAKQLKKAA